jgi:hypothetical protein
LVYFWNVIWLFYQLFIHVCSEANVRKFLFCIFPSVFLLLVWSVRTRSALSISYLTACRPEEYVPRLDASFFLSLSNTHTHTHYFLHVLSCCVVYVFSRTDLEILAFSAHLFSFPGISFDFSYSLKLWFFLEYWNL